MSKQLNVLVFGATGMVGQGVLRECLLDRDVAKVAAVGRTPTGKSDAKFADIVVTDMTNYASVEDRLTGYDACFFCLGVSSVGMNEETYTKLTYDLTMAAATTLARLNPDMTFVYVTGAGTDSTEKGQSMWARVKGRTENALLALPFRAAYMFRPGGIEPMNGEVPKTASVRWIYYLMRPVFPLLTKMLPKYITTTERMGRAMLKVARDGNATHIVDIDDINRLGLM
ncbi:putative NAD(P)-binding protein [Luteibacter rhizovicinus]|uniref:Putative NAD(P)-binding protein n=1 Tax=Luteibacter rhizovicinus TaxID=242606 RepID=A0A4R3YI85_9GAMM|nr:NAD(P)H-binding protein [Luteibacter rhizovicinus]TCV92355.1 putative NAD(P)-binding protein [Luteibacter rhizovicinus]